MNLENTQQSSSRLSHADFARGGLADFPAFAHLREPRPAFKEAGLYVRDEPQLLGLQAAPQKQKGQHGPLTRQVYAQNLPVWGSLKREALRARASYVYTARAAAVAEFRGQPQRSERLARLACKQRQRWQDASLALDIFES